MNTIKSKFRTFKIGLNIFLLTILVIILAQNVRPIDMRILFWEVHIPLVILLMGTAVLSAMIAFISILMIGGKSSKSQI